MKTSGSSTKPRVPSRQGLRKFQQIEEPIGIEALRELARSGERATTPA